MGIPGGHRRRDVSSVNGRLDFFKSISRFPLARNHLNLPLTEKQAAALLAEKAEAADARKKAARHMLDATNFSPWL